MTPCRSIPRAPVSARAASARRSKIASRPPAPRAGRLPPAGALRGLPRREPTILYLRFVEGLTQTEIADRVGLSQMYVSRLLRATLEQLRGAIEPGASPD